MLWKCCHFRQVKLMLYTSLGYETEQAVPIFLNNLNRYPLLDYYIINKKRSELNLKNKIIIILIFC